MAAAALVYETDGGLEEGRERTSRRCKTWSPVGLRRLPDEIRTDGPTSGDEATTCSWTSTSKEMTMSPHSASTSMDEEDSSLEGDVKEGADEYEDWGDTDVESDYNCSPTFKKANWADQTDQEFGRVIGLGGRVLGTESIREAPAAAGPPMHAGQHADTPGQCQWAAGVPQQQSQPHIARLPPLTPSWPGPSSGADTGASPVGNGTGASPVGNGSNRKAGGLQTKSTKANGNKPGNVTTLMVRNLPPTLKQKDFLRELDVTGFENTYDICYLPRDFSSGQCQGHAFVNFKEAADASRFRVVWHKTERFGCCDPLVDVSPARIQGYEANAREAESSKAKRRVRNPNFRRLIKDQAAEPPSPLGSPCNADFGTPTRHPHSPTSSWNTAAFATSPSHAATSSPASFHGSPCHDAGYGVADSARPAPQELLSTRCNTLARPAAQYHLTPSLLGSSPAVVPHAVPGGATVNIFTLMGSPQHSVLQETPPFPVTSIPNYRRIAAR